MTAMCAMQLDKRDGIVILLLHYNCRLRHAMYLSLESNFTSFIGPWGVKQADRDVMSNRLIIVGFQSCYWNLEV